MNNPIYYIIHNYKIRPVIIKNKHERYNGLSMEYRVKCLDGAEESLTVAESRLYDTKKEALPKVIELLNTLITEYKCKIEAWTNRKDCYEKELNI